MHFGGGESDCAHHRGEAVDAKWMRLDVLVPMLQTTLSLVIKAKIIAPKICVMGRTPSMTCRVQIGGLGGVIIPGMTGDR